MTAKITVGDIYSFINEIAPFSLQQSYDNSGICAGSRDMPVTRVLTSLDITSAVVDEAAAKGCELVLSHHPVIFRPLRTLSPDNPAVKLAVKGIAAICMHTSFDSAEGGMNDLLAAKLGFTVREVLDYDDGKPMGYVCKPEKAFTAHTLAEHCKTLLGCKVVRFTDAPAPIDLIGVCSGSGGSCLKAALSKGCGALITGDVKHSDFVAASDCGFCLIDAGHYYTANIFHADIARRLCERFEGLEVVPAESFPDPVQIVT